ncbi:hypothetical protein [Sulfurimonas indica]|uniref:hypothetical protein n=1 Tax=Sulfurimonas TaxID=202746 RepID=UPI00126592EB|nr:hypothetical protein [Sulfurimonas indica]
MLEKKLVQKILNVSPKTVYNYYREKRPIIELLEKFFSNEDLERFLENRALGKFDVDIHTEQANLNKELLSRIERLEHKITEMEKKQK